MTQATQKQVEQYLYDLDDDLVWDASADEYTPLLREDARRIAKALSKRFMLAERPVRVPQYGTERVVHATVHSDLEGRYDIVRYDKAGKYFMEARDGSSRVRLTLSQVVDYIVGPIPQGMRVTYHEGRYGSQMLKAAVRRRRVQNNG